MNPEEGKLIIYECREDGSIGEGKNLGSTSL
jgi:hypothetical protein